MSSEFIEAAHGALGTIYINLSNVLYAYSFGPDNHIWVMTTGEKLHTLTGGIPLAEMIAPPNKE